LSRGHVDNPYISHGFIGNTLVLEMFNFAMDINNKSMSFIAGPGIVEVYHREDVRMVQLCFFEKGQLSNPELRGAIVVRFVETISFFDKKIDPPETLTLALNLPFKNFRIFKLMAAETERFFTGLPFSRPLKNPPIVEVLSFTRFPEFLKEIIPKVPKLNSSQVRSRIRRELAKDVYDDRAFSVMSVYSNYSLHKGSALSPSIVILSPSIAPLPPSVVCLGDDSEDEMSSQASDDYYYIGNMRCQISRDGLKSLNPGAFLNDEIINIGLGNVQGRFTDVHVFDTYNTAKIFEVFADKNEDYTMSYTDFNQCFGSFFNKQSAEARDVSETFLSKKMLIFPICHCKHWLLVVILNPLLLDNMNAIDSRREKELQPKAYFIDSLRGTPKYADSMLDLRLEATWPPIFTFVRLAAFHHGFCYLNPIACDYSNNIPSQENDWDCGPHTVINAALVAEMLNELSQGKPLMISPEKAGEVMTKVNAFRADFKKYIQSCK
ncbi:hypothetical protein PMAYCL1PPCAC_31546, partial [Pristionchus mayeri]